MILPSKVKFIDKGIEKAFYDLGKGKNSEKQLLKFLNRAFKDIEENAFCGIQTPKKLIPKSYIQKYKIKNLWKYDLPQGWRLLYSIETQEIIVVSIILEWMTHKEYDRKFKY